MTTRTLIVAFLVCSITHTDSRADESFEMDEIVRELKQWQDSLKSVTLTYIVKGDPNSQLMKESGKKGVQRYSETTMAWDNFGRLYKHRVGSHDDKVVLRSLTASGREKSFRTSYPQGESEKTRPYLVELRSQNTGRPRPPIAVGVLEAPFIGLWYPREKKWLGELLEEGHGKIVGQKKIDGVICPTIELHIPKAEESDETDPSKQIELSLHPKHHFLPCRYNGSGFNVQTTEFREVAPELFFPGKGSIDSEVDFQPWEVKTVSINSPLKKSLFEPPVGRGKTHRLSRR